IKILIIQIMGLVFQVMVLRCIGKSVYILEPVSNFHFPSSFSGIQVGSIQTLLNNLDQIK
ncbi:hypothetical protein K501DRAFT_129304, partial [Backusella circina FSU 941]